MRKLKKIVKDLEKAVNESKKKYKENGELTEDEKWDTIAAMFCLEDGRNRLKRIK